MSDVVDASILRFGPGGLVRADDPAHAVDFPTLAVLGDPIAHSLSPLLHRAALRERGVDASYAAVEVPVRELSEFLRQGLASGMRGLNLTRPLKQAVLEAVPARSEEVERIGAANTLSVRRGRWHAHNTDARGLAMALENWRGRRLQLAMHDVVVIGAGGAARAAVTCAQALGARRITVAARRPEAASWAPVWGVNVRALSPEALAKATLVLQCTPLGVDPERDPSPVSLERLASSAIAVDLTYGNVESAFLREARSRGVEAIDGLPMLIAQAALAFSMWYGEQPPVRAMAAAVGRNW